MWRTRERATEVRPHVTKRPPNPLGPILYVLISQPKLLAARTGAVDPTDSIR